MTVTELVMTLCHETLKVYHLTKRIDDFLYKKYIKNINIAKILPINDLLFQSYQDVSN